MNCTLKYGIVRAVIWIGTFLFLLNSACQPAPKDIYETIAQEVDQLESVEAQQAFLETILKEDQEVRTKDSELLQQYGINSPEYQENARKIIQQDRINQIKIDRYLSKFPYPNKSEMGKDACMAPWLVIHHNTDLAQRNSYFYMLYGAYKKGDISSTQFCLYLGRSHEFAFGSRLQMESPYSEEEEIIALMKALDLGE